MSVADLKRLMSGWMFRPIPLWMVFVIVGVCVTPFVPSAGVLAAILAVAWLVVQRIVSDRRKASQEEGEASGQSATDTAVELRFENFFLVRIVRGVFEIVPRSFGECIAWLAVWLAPAFVWASVFFIQEDRVHSGGPRGHLDEIDIELLLVGYGVCAIWMLVSLLWFKRRRLDGTSLFARGARWRGVLGTLGLASIFVVCGYQTWKSDVYLRVIRRQSPLGSAMAMEVPRAATIAQHTMLRVEFEVAVNDMEVVIDFDDGRVVKFSPAHHGIIVHVSEHPGTYKWRAMLKGEHIADGEVALEAGQLAEINVPRPKLSQLIAGRWESDPALKEGGLYGNSDEGPGQYEFEFTGKTSTLAIHEPSSRSVSRIDFGVVIDEFVTPALIDLKMNDGENVDVTMTGIVRFQPGRKTNYRMHSQYRLSPLIPGESEMTLPDEAASSGGAASMGSGFGGSTNIATADEPDRLIICVTQGAGLRPWEFKADEDRAHMLFTLVRSRESESLRQKLAFEPIVLETPKDLIKESTRAWAERLKIDAQGTNSAGIELVLVPPAADHLVDQPHLATLRRQLPEPGSIRDSIESDPTFTYEFPPKLKEKISRRTKFVSYPFVMSRQLVTIDQFQRFIDETGYMTDAERGTSLFPDVPIKSDTESSDESAKSGGETAPKPEPATEIKGGWRRPGHLFNWADGLTWQSSMESDDAKPERPVSVVSWRDATEFCKWLSEKEGRQYRLPTNDEWTAAMQLGAPRKQLPSSKSDEPMFNDYYGWFDENSKHPLGIAGTRNTFAEWTQDAHFPTNPDQMVLVHREISDDGVRFYLGTQYTAQKSFRADNIGFRVVAELQALAVEKSEDASSE